MARSRRPRRAAERAMVALLTTMAALAALAALAGCTAESSAGEPLPGGVSLSVFQSRSDYTARKLEVAVTNGTDRDLTITGLTFTSAQFQGPAVWPKESTIIRGGVTANLPVSLPAADCSAKKPTPQVELRYRLAGEPERSGFGVPEDSLGQLAPLLAADCFRESVDERAEITLGSEPRITAVGGVLVAQLDVRLTSTGAPGSVTVESAQGTTLLALWDPVTQGRVPTQSLGITVVSPGPPATVTLSLFPNRCDPHAIAEDKLGTVLPFAVALEDGSSGVVTVASPTAVRAALYAFVQRACDTE